MLRNLQASFRQKNEINLPDKQHNLWIHYFTIQNPKSLSSVSKNSPQNAHYMNFNIQDFNMKNLIMQKAAIESNPATTLPVLFHLEQPISPHYFKFCMTVESMNLDKSAYSNIAQEAGPQIIKFLISFTYQFQQRLTDIRNNKDNSFFPFRFLTEFKYVVRLMLSTQNQLFLDFLYLLNNLLTIISNTKGSSLIITQFSVDIISNFLHFFQSYQTPFDELKPIVTFISIFFMNSDSQNSLFSDFCAILSQNIELFPYSFSEEGYKKFVCAIEKSIIRICSQKFNKQNFECVSIYIKSVAKTIYRQKNEFDLTPTILFVIKWILKDNELPELSTNNASESLSLKLDLDDLFVFTSLNLFDDSVSFTANTKSKKIQATYILTSPYISKICEHLSSLCSHNKYLIKSVLTNFALENDIKFIYFATASIYGCNSNFILNQLIETGTYKHFFTLEIFNESTLLNTSENKYLINLKDLLLQFLMTSESNDVPVILSKLLDTSRPIIVFKILQLFNDLLSPHFLKKCQKGSTFDIMMIIYETYKSYLLKHEDYQIMKQCRSCILHFVLSFINSSDENLNYVFANGRRIDFILSLLFENKSFDNGIEIICRALNCKNIGLLLNQITSLIKVGFDHMDMKEWCDLYNIIIDCISASIMANKENVIKKFISSGSIAIFSRIPISFANLDNDNLEIQKSNVLRFLIKILQLFSTLTTGSYRMIKALSNPQWNFVANLKKAIRFCDITNDVVDLLTHFATIGDTLWVTTGIELLLVAAEKDDVREKILEILINLVKDDNIANRFKCYEANTIGYLLEYLLKAMPNNLALDLFTLVGSTYFRMREVSLAIRILANNSNLSIPILKSLIEITKRQLISLNLPKSFFHFTTQNSFRIDNFTIPQSFSVATNVHFPFEFKKKTAFFTIENDQQSLILYIMENKFILDIHNKKKEHSFQLCTNIKPKTWFSIILSIQTNKLSFFVNSALITSSVIPSKFKFNSNVCFVINNIKCDVEYIKINSNESSFFSNFTAKCVNDGICMNRYNQSPIQKAKFTGLAIPFIISFVDAIPTCGGPLIFLPLFEKIQEIDFFYCLLELVNYLAQCNQKMFEGTQFFRALAHLLLNIDSKYFTSKIIELIYQIYQSFSINEIKCDMLQHIFGNFSIWKRISKENQLMVYSGIFTSLIQLDSQNFNDILYFDEILLKFNLIYENETEKDDLMLKSTNILLMMSQTKFSQRDARVLIGSLIKDPSNEMCLNSLFLLINIINDNSKEMMDFLKQVNYFPPFIEVLNSRFEKTRIIGMQSLYYLLNILKVDTNILSTEIISAIRLINVQETTDLSLINILCFMTKSAKYLDFPHISTEFDFDNLKTIEYPQFLALFADLLFISQNEIKQKSLDYLFKNIIQNEQTRINISNCELWTLWLSFLSNIDNNNNWYEAIGSILLSTNQLKKNILELSVLSILFGKPIEKQIKYTLIQRQIESIEIACLTLKSILFNRTSDLIEYTTNNSIHTFAQVIVTGKLTSMDIEYNENVKEVDALFNTIKFLSKQGLEFLLRDDILPTILNFTTLCYLIHVFGENDKIKLFHLLTPCLQNVINEPELTKGIAILIDVVKDKPDELNELIELLKKTDPIFESFGEANILASLTPIREEFFVSINRLNYEIHKEFFDSVNEKHSELINHLQKVFMNDIPLMNEVRSEFDHDLFAISQDTDRSLRKNYKFWHTIRKELNLQNGGPWFSIPTDPHYKFDFSLDKLGRRNKLLLNRQFLDYKNAAYDSSLEDSTETKKVRKLYISTKEQIESPNNYTIALHCQMVTILHNFNGIMYLSKSSIYFEAKETTNAFGDLINKTSKLIEIPTNAIKFILKRRYLCIDSGVEIFTIYNQSFYFTFASDVQRTDFFNEINKIKPVNLEFVQLGNSRGVYYDLKIQKRWSTGEMTNYEYIWWLNALSGRSIHDTSQYPVYPWILSDYRSSQLDLNDPNVYRDLSKPVGALNKERLDNLKFLYNEMKSTPFACLYRFHYSTPAYVILYLLRKEPFTTLHIQLQNERFDHPNRLFFSIASAWDSVTSTQSDFRELIPEFFATPEFLLNTDNYPLGTRFDFVSMKTSLSFGGVEELGKQATRTSSLSNLTSAIEVKEVSTDDNNIDEDETFTSILDITNADSNNTSNENQISKSDTTNENQNENNLNLKSIQEKSDSVLIDNNFEQIDVCITDAESINHSSLKKQSSKPGVNFSTAQLGLTYSPSLNNFLGVKLIKTKSGSMVRRDFKVNDVELPLWAPSASAFIAVNSLALESSYVSQNINKWIDLVFGIKQKSEEANNIFHPFSYMQKTPTDPDELATLQQHVANFGVTPECLFTALHPIRKFKPIPHSLQKVKIGSLNKKENNTNSNQNEPIEQPILSTKNDCLDLNVIEIHKFNEKVLKINVSDGSFYGVFEKDSTLRSYNYKSEDLTSPNDHSKTRGGFIEFGSNFDSNPTSIKQLKLSAHLTPDRIFLTSDANLIICAPWSQGFDLIDLKINKKWSPNESIAHAAVVTDIACEGNYVVTCAEDSSLYVWDLHSKKKLTTIVAHIDQIIHVAVSNELEVVVSCDRNGELLFSSMRTGKFIIKKHFGLNEMTSYPMKIMISTLGFVVLIFDSFEDENSHSTYIHLIDMGGRLLNQVKLEGKMTSSILMQNQDRSSYLVVAQETKLVYVMRIFDLMIVSMGPVNGIVKDMCYSKDDLSLFMLTENNELLLTNFHI